MDTEITRNYRDEYRAQLLEYAKESQTSYDTTLITLASGALGISFAFVGQFIGNDPVQGPYLLASSWICWIVTLALILLSFATSRLALYKAVRQVDSGEQLSANPGGWLNRLTEMLNVLAGLLFFGGVVAMMCFAYINL